MTVRFSRVLAVVAAVFVSQMLAPALARAADSETKTDGAGWVLPGLNNVTGWHPQLKDARAEAAKENKPILIVFSGPDWSTNSKKFESSVLKSTEFAKTVRPAVVCLYVQHFVNTYAPAEQVSANQSLRKGLSVPAVYPCTVILAADGKKVLGVIPGALDRKTYLQQISKLTGISVSE